MQTFGTKNHAILALLSGAHAHRTHILGRHVDF